MTPISLPQIPAHYHHVLIQLPLLLPHQLIQAQLFPLHLPTPTPSPFVHYPTSPLAQSPPSSSSQPSIRPTSSSIDSFSLSLSNLNATDISHISPSSSSSPSPLLISRSDNLSASFRPNTIPLPSPPMTTQAKAGIFKPKTLLSTFLIDWSLTEPTRVKDALATPSWKQAMNDEYNALVKNQT
ncbi:putative mitochondrial protein [Cucumis melo var. makuwa]|uniref:Mitochondrial protein n=1 Tax=Cucumis melo var. makuwa TaxID=1194695 RepID=A0A5D3E2Q4_CUCMM|nr:putative mitochondrial protein [Cucumis melo var. makuwa]TYK30172.1 putative mitochondrial protein [Cucumis melo var. makuwa]